MVNVVMEKETHLLSGAEWDVLKVYHRLDCMCSASHFCFGFLQIVSLISWLL